MNRAHVFIAVLLNLVSVQVTFGGPGEPMMYYAPSSYETRSVSAQPLIQAQYHPASGTIQQGIMIPQEHRVPLERVPEELYYQERIVPQESLLPSERMGPQGSLQESWVPLSNSMPQERMMLSSQVNKVPAPQERMVSQENVQKIVHTSPTHPQPAQKEKQINSDLVDAQNLRSEEDPRAVKNGYEYPHQQTYPAAPSYGYNTPASSYNPASPAPSYSSSSVASYPSHADHSSPTTKFLLKPDLTELITPAQGKMAGKLSGLAGLALSLLGSGKGLELTGMKDLLIDGILKPLLVAKGGLKALISKLSIPVIALILINVEVLITVWWLWEECPEQKPAVEYTKPTYPAGVAANNYNNSYR